MAKVKKTKYAQDMLFEDLFLVHDAMLVLISSPIELSKYNCFHSSEATVATVKIIQLSFNPATVLAWENLAVTTALIKSSTRLEKWKITYVYVLTYSLLLKSFVFPLNPSSSMSYQNWITFTVATVASLLWKQLYSLNSMGDEMSTSIASLTGNRSSKSISSAYFVFLTFAISNLLLQNLLQYVHPA